MSRASRARSGRPRGWRQARVDTLAGMTGAVAAISSRIRRYHTRSRWQAGGSFRDADCHVPPARRFDVDFDLPERLHARNSPCDLPQNRPELHDVSAVVVSISNFYALFKDRHPGPA